MEITPATLDDVPRLCELLELLFAQEAEFVPNSTLQLRALRQIIEAPECGRILVGRQDDAVVGMVVLLWTVSTALGSRVAILEDMIVHPLQRGNGVGSALLQAAKEAARAAGCARITLLTDARNEAAQRFYGRAGFAVSEMMPMRLIL